MPRFRLPQIESRRSPQPLAPVPREAMLKRSVTGQHHFESAPRADVSTQAGVYQGCKVDEIDCGHRLLVERNGSDGGVPERTGSRTAKLCSQGRNIVQLH